MNSTETQSDLSASSLRDSLRLRRKRIQKFELLSRRLAEAQKQIHSTGIGLQAVLQVGAELDQIPPEELSVGERTELERTVGACLQERARFVLEASPIDATRAAGVAGNYFGKETGRNLTRLGDALQREAEALTLKVPAEREAAIWQAVAQATQGRKELAPLNRAAARQLKSIQAQRARRFSLSVLPTLSIGAPVRRLLDAAPRGNRSWPLIALGFLAVEAILILALTRLIPETSSETLAAIPMATGEPKALTADVPVAKATLAAIVMPSPATSAVALASKGTPKLTGTRAYAATASLTADAAPPINPEQASPDSNIAVSATAASLAPRAHPTSTAAPTARPESVAGLTTRRTLPTTQTVRPASTATPTARPAATAVIPILTSLPGCTGPGCGKP